MYRQPIKKFISPLPEITLGCSNYLQLIKKSISEFSEKSIVCLDSDATQQVDRKNHKTVVLLPGNLPPDQLIFEYLYNLPASDEFWQNELQFTRDVFTNAAAEVIREFSIQGSSLNINERIALYQGSEKPREIFKRFYKDDYFQKLVSSPSKSFNPWRQWILSNPEAYNEFLETFTQTLRSVMIHGYTVDGNKLAAVKVNLRRG